MCLVRLLDSHRSGSYTKVTVFCFLTSCFSLYLWGFIFSYFCSLSPIPPWIKTSFPPYFAEVLLRSGLFLLLGTVLIDTNLSLSLQLWF